MNENKVEKRGYMGASKNIVLIGILLSTFFFQSCITTNIYHDNFRFAGLYSDDYYQERLEQPSKVKRTLYYSGYLIIVPIDAATSPIQVPLLLIGAFFNPLVLLLFLPPFLQPKINWQ